MNNGATNEIQQYLAPYRNYGSFTFLDVPIEQICGPVPNQLIQHVHTDKWLLCHSPYRDFVIHWVKESLGKS